MHLYELLPILKKAAYNGQRSLYFNSIYAKELSEISDELSTHLFKTGIYSIVATSREFAINILKDNIGRHYSGEFINQNYIDSADDDDDDDF